ncbi:polysaccharide lyase family 7 protein [Kitasatospora sp. NBC_01302]|uniref:polysaccharide lyase family 7 protein n=1 Tax=Kitasatospora sp. NBC_01302 TaxID=2903575 RepID=UPI002E1642EE|nr:polysaccharide lyase family 7 protein [Kitasatospora sp. NBC_01302]
MTDTQRATARSRARAGGAAAAVAGALLLSGCGGTGGSGGAAGASGHHRAAASAPTAAPTTAPTAATTAQAGGCTTAAPASGAGPAVTPVDLNAWQLILPVAKPGDPKAAEQLTPARPTDPYLTQGPGGSLTFWAPAGGATTAHSLHSRTELAALGTFTPGTACHHLTESLAVGQLPEVSHEITIGQIHGTDADEAAPFVMLAVQGDSVGVTLETVPKSEGSVGPAPAGEKILKYHLLSGVRLGTPFGYTMTDNGNGTLTFTGDCAGTPGCQAGSPVTVPVPPAWSGHLVRFMAGDYEQDDAATSHTGGGRLTVFGVGVS